MATGLIVGGLALATAAFGVRYALRLGKMLSETVGDQVKQLGKSEILSKYYRGGFEPKMSRREAGLVLGISPSASSRKIKEAHKRIMLLNHPDRGGSPYIATKINTAKDYLDSHKS